MNTPTLIKAKDLKVNDRWKKSLSDRLCSIVTQLYDIDPDQSQTSPMFQNKILVLEGNKEFLLDKNADVFRFEYVTFYEFITKYLKREYL
jgi:hypothetical protein